MWDPDFPLCSCPFPLQFACNNCWSWMLVKKADCFKTDSTSVYSESYWHFYMSSMKMGECNVRMAEYTSEIFCLKDNFRNLTSLLYNYESKCCSGLVTKCLEIMLWKWIKIWSFSTYSQVLHTSSYFLYTTHGRWNHRIWNIKWLLNKLPSCMKLCGAIELKDILVTNISCHNLHLIDWHERRLSSKL